MRLSVGMKVGLVSLFSCLALWLGLLSPTGMVSAQTANTLRYGCDNNQQLRQH